MMDKTQEAFCVTKKPWIQSFMKARKENILKYNAYSMPRVSEPLIVLTTSLIKETTTAIKMLKNSPVSIIKLLSKGSRQEDLHVFHKIVERSCELHKISAQVSPRVH